MYDVTNTFHNYLLQLVSYKAAKCISESSYPDNVHGYSALNSRILKQATYFRTLSYLCKNLPETMHDVTNTPQNYLLLPNVYKTAKCVSET